MSSGANDQAKVLQFATFRDHGCGHVALYPRPHPPHNEFFSTLKELGETF